MDEVDDVRLVVERVAALDPGKRLWRSACAPPAAARPADAGAARLRHHHRTAVGDGGVVVAVAGAAGGDGIHSTYWKGVYYLLEAEGFECWLVNAREVKNVPGRAKTDRADAVWLAKVAERACVGPRWCSRPRSVGCAI